MLLVFAISFDLIHLHLLCIVLIFSPAVDQLSTLCTVIVNCYISHSPSIEQSRCIKEMESHCHPWWPRMEWSKLANHENSFTSHNPLMSDAMVMIAFSRAANSPGRCRATEYGLWGLGDGCWMSNWGVMGWSRWFGGVATSPAFGVGSAWENSDCYTSSTLWSLRRSERDHWNGIR